MAKQFNIQAKTIIESASLELDANQLEALADAAPHLRAVVSDLEESPQAADHELAKGVLPILYLAESIASLVDQAGTIKSKVIRRPKPKGNPTSGT